MVQLTQSSAVLMPTSLAKLCWFLASWRDRSHDLQTQWVLMAWLYPGQLGEVTSLLSLPPPPACHLSRSPAASGSTWLWLDALRSQLGLDGWNQAGWRRSGRPNGWKRFRRSNETHKQKRFVSIVRGKEGGREEGMGERRTLSKLTVKPWWFCVWD